MTVNISEAKKKIRKSKGQRTYIRRLKQAARKEIKPNRPQSSLPKTVIHKTQEEA